MEKTRPERQRTQRTASAAVLLSKIDAWSYHFASYPSAAVNTTPTTSRPTP